MENSPKYKNVNNSLPSPRSYNNCSTFVQTDTSSFKQVVQILTGSSFHTPKHVSIPPIKVVPNKKQSSSSFRIYERRNSMKNLKINPMKSGVNHWKSEILSPSMLNFPCLVLSPVSPLESDPLNGSGSLKQQSESEEERGIKEKGFYLHPSPRNVEPQLLPLFPLTSPRISSSLASTFS